MQISVYEILLFMVDFPFLIVLVEELVSQLPVVVCTVLDGISTNDLDFVDMALVVVLVPRGTPTQTGLPSRLVVVAPG